MIAKKSQVYQKNPADSPQIDGFSLSFFEIFEIRFRKRSFTTSTVGVNVSSLRLVSPKDHFFHGRHLSQSLGEGHVRDSLKILVPIETRTDFVQGPAALMKKMAGGDNLFFKKMNGNFIERAGSHPKENS